MLLRKATSTIYMKLCIIMLGIFAMGGCTTIYKGVGNTLLSYTDDELIPFVMTTDDPQMVCNAGISLTPALLSLERVTAKTDKPAVLVYLMAGLCAENDALSEELRYLRAVYHQDVEEAQDARIAQKRHLTLAAKRQYIAYQSLVSYLGEPRETCPEFKTQDDELVWLIGSASGMRSVLNDIASGMHANVPKDIAGKSVRATRCLDNQTWWGVPQAIQATLQVILPSTGSTATDPWQDLETASAIGESTGVRLSLALHAIAAQTTGDTKKVKELIKRFAEPNTTFEQNPDQRFIDAIATSMIEALSDRLWTEYTGKRTPIGELGTFWDDSTGSDGAIDLDDIL